MLKYSVMSHSYLTDGLENYSHQSPIIKLAFISKTLSGIAQIGCLDENGIVSVWSVVEIMGHHGTDYDLNMNLGGKFKIVLNYSQNLLDYSNVVDMMSMFDVTQSIVIEFDPTDS
jgi:hypothetical protein